MKDNNPINQLIGNKDPFSISRKKFFEILEVHRKMTYEDTLAEVEKMIKDEYEIDYFGMDTEELCNRHKLLNEFKQKLQKLKEKEK